MRNYKIEIEIYEGKGGQLQKDDDGVTTEFIRCVDPTESGIVVKVIRTQMPD